MSHHPRPHQRGGEQSRGADDPGPLPPLPGAALPHVVPAQGPRRAPVQGCGRPRLPLRPPRGRCRPRRHLRGCHGAPPPARRDPGRRPDDPGREACGEQGAHPDPRREACGDWAGD
ncbi:hypothetical protein BS78_04G023700 [Paspalum vaginatum]|nr:hypothetical protein BS78_04G023700 [Paspalum vaginatum]